MSYEIHLEVFDGPFDLLFHLIEKNQVDIYDIPIAQITDQYLEYLGAMEALDLDLASSFLVMAANLLAIKAKMLLPKNVLEEDGEEPEDFRQELVHDLLEYKRFKELATLLEDCSNQQAKFISRPNEEELYINLFAPENPIQGRTLQDLTEAFHLILKKNANRHQVMEIEREQITVSQKMEEILNVLKRKRNGLEFASLFDVCFDKYEMIVTFLALLELVRQFKVHIRQNDRFEEIYLYA